MGFFDFIGNAIQSVASTWTFGIIPPPGGGDGSTESSLSGPERERLEAEAFNKATLEANNVLAEYGIGPIELPGKSPPGPSDPPHPAGRVYGLAPLSENPVRIN